MQSTHLSFTGPAGKRLTLNLDLPLDREPTACAFFVHCFSCSRDLEPVRQISRALTQEGLAVARFDFTGWDEAESEFSATTLASDVEDLVAAGEYLQETGRPAQLLIGHSLGGAAAIRAAARMTSIRAVATIAAPFDPWQAARMFAASRAEVEQKGEAEVRIGERTFTAPSQLLEELAGENLKEALRGLRRALLVLHAPLDQNVGIGNAARIFAAARHPKSFVSLDDADHLLTRHSDARYAAAVIAAWASRYLPAREPARTERDVIADNRVATYTGRSGFLTEVRVRGHGLIADEPAVLGGTDAGPTPYDLLLAALGTCTGMTLRMYADRKEWPLEDIRVVLRHQKISARDEARPEDSDARLDRIDRQLAVTGDLTTEQITRLLEIADRCPVHRTLDAGVQISTRLMEDADDPTP